MVQRQHHSKRKSQYVFNFSMMDIDLLHSFLTSSDLLMSSNSIDVEVIWNTIKSAILLSMDQSIPKIKVIDDHSSPWFTGEIRHQIKCARSLRRRHKLHPTDNTANKLKNLTENLEHFTTQAKKNYEETMINNLSSNRNYKVYHYISRITGNTGIPNLLNLDDTTAQSDFERACLFNEYFQSIFTQSSPVITPRIASSTSDLLTSIFISEQDVYTVLSTLARHFQGYRNRWYQTFDIEIMCCRFEQASPASIYLLFETV